MPPVDVEECPVWLFDWMASMQSVAVVPETFGSLAQELFDSMSMLAKKAVPFDFVVDQYPTIAIKNTERGRIKAVTSCSTHKIDQQETDG